VHDVCCNGFKGGALEVRNTLFLEAKDVRRGRVNPVPTYISVLELGGFQKAPVNKICGLK